MRKKSVRIIAIIIVVVMVLGVFSGVLSMFAWAATPNIRIADITCYKEENVRVDITDLKVDERFKLELKYTLEGFIDDNNKPDISAINIINDKSTLGYIHETGESSYDERGRLIITFNDVSVKSFKSPVILAFEVEVESKTYPLTVELYEGTGTTDVTILSADTTVSQTLRVGKVSSGVTVNFRFLCDYLDLDDNDKAEIKFDEFSMPANSSFGWSENSRLVISKPKNSNSYRAELRNITYNGGSSKSLELTINSYNYDFKADFVVPISNKYFSDSSTTEDETPPVSDIVVQSVHALNIDGEPLSEVTKDTPPFSVRITFYDVGLKDVSKTVLKESEMRAFITSATGFKTLGGTVGEIEILTSNAEYPRFQATFKNLTSDGSATSIGFRVQYDLKGFGSEGLDLGVKGEATANLFQVTEIKDEESSKDEAVPLKPNVIVQEYSYTNEENPTVTAGEEFDLELKIHNTSKSTGVENIVMTIEPNDGFVIADASNTVYFSSIAPDEVKPFSIALRAMPSAGNAANATPTDYSLQVKFSYQYLSAANKYEGPVESGGKIAIPVEQLDRFAVEEITEYSQMLTVGEEGTVTVPVINKGKSLIYNISGLIRAVEPFDFISPITHIGNLEAGKSGTIDLPITINEPGEFTGEAVISYEDENSNVKELTATFTILVNEMYIPPVETPSGPVVDVDAPKGPSAVSVASCLVGALMVASPIGLYLVKRAKSRGIEDFDEDF